MKLAGNWPGQWPTRPPITQVARTSSGTQMGPTGVARSSLFAREAKRRYEVWRARYEDVRFDDPLSPAGAAAKDGWRTLEERLEALNQRLQRYPSWE
jgi:hypothetical protein